MASLATMKLQHQHLSPLHPLTLRPKPHCCATPHSIAVSATNPSLW
jgi:hypothetical protein